MWHRYEISPLRWGIKKIARHWVSHAGLALRSLSSRDKATIRVLTYHRFSSNVLDPVSVHPDAFAEQMRWLMQNVDILDPSRFHLVMSGALPLEHPSVLITIDDGHYSVYRHALPVMREWAIPAVLFVCPGLVESQGPRKFEFMSWDELRVAGSANILVGSHGYSHISLGRTSRGRALVEIDEAHEAIRQNLLLSPRYFSFPFGTVADCPQHVVSALRSAGYSYIFSSSHGAIDPDRQPVLLPRIKLESAESLTMFERIVRGGLDLWGSFDRYAATLQRRDRL